MKPETKCGLVLEGGAMRGLFTAGVLDVFLENGIAFDGFVGVSAGGDTMEWMRASASMPLVSSVVRIGGGRYLDGAITDSIPLEFMERTGYGRNVVILTQPEGYVKKPSSLQWLMRTVYRKYPALVEAAAHRHAVYNAQTEYVRKRENEGAAFVIRPERPLPVRRVTHDPGLLQETYDIGRRTAEQKLEQIGSFIHAGRD